MRHNIHRTTGEFGEPAAQGHFRKARTIVDPAFMALISRRQIAKKSISVFIAPEGKSRPEAHIKKDITVPVRVKFCGTNCCNAVEMDSCNRLWIFASAAQLDSWFPARRHSDHHITRSNLYLILQTAPCCELVVC
jgi:hypothetical protein